jgi:hypothetical protein
MQKQEVGKLQSAATMRGARCTAQITRQSVDVGITVLPASGARQKILKRMPNYYGGWWITAVKVLSGLSDEE